MKGPRQKKLAEGLAQKIISLTAHASGGGAGMPPISSASPSRHHPASLIACTVLANSGGTLMVWASGSNTGGIAVGEGKGLGNRAFRQASGFRQYRSYGVLVEVAVASGAEDSAYIKNFEEVELEITDVSDVVAQG